MSEKIFLLVEVTDENQAGYTKEELLKGLTKELGSKSQDCTCTSKLAAFQEEFGKVKKLSVSKLLTYAEEDLNLLIVPGFSRPFIINEIGYRLQDKYVGTTEKAKKNHLKIRKQLWAAMKKGV